MAPRITLKDINNKVNALGLTIEEVTRETKVALAGIGNEQTNVSGSIVEMKDSIKVTHNSKGTNWEIKLVEKEGRNNLVELDRLEKEMEKRYGKR